jgi:KaiC/GvpD/RAD55 family RecA-like ATPase
MSSQTVIIANPFARLGNNVEDIIEKGGFGAVLARAGVGKTALLVQLALNHMLRNRNVLHISLKDPVAKISLWYKEIFNNLAEQNKVGNAQEIWESLLPHRFIMTFKVEGFSVPKLEERLTDLTEQNVFCPDLVIIDGLPFDENVSAVLNDLKKLPCQKMSFWFAVTTHRHEAPETSAMPPQMVPVANLFDIIIQLRPHERMIHVISLKGNTSTDESPLIFDPAAMILKEKS